ncbi:hypothetical protein [Micromonospora craniellae]|uniref:hypothetical protein n=1 Tax=Micromonospora craniellae TaxID=2294034 RepID=UPI001314E108|nr:hypothetical protein [Micromonospora craniellae]QOC94428.1 hypothetical protein ID554_13115 [Micromonospora craniellae]
MAGIWRDFVTAAVDAVRERDEQPRPDERRRALDRLATQKIRESQRVRPPER